MAIASAQDTLDKWSDLVRQASKDESLKRRLKENPAAVLQEFGMKVCPGIEVRIVENTDKVGYLTLPRKPAEGDLTPDQMDQVVGGTKAGGTPIRYLQYDLKEVFISS